MKMSTLLISIILIFFFYQISFAANMIPALTKGKKLVVFVHGYNAKETWTNEQFYWPEAMHIDNDFRYYDIYVADFKTGLCAGENIKKTANKLFKEIKSVIDKFNDISFIAHSMGGLVVREIVMSNYDYFKNRFSMTKSVLNLIDLDTPNLGAGLAQITRLCSEQAADLVVNSNFLDTLNEEWRSKFLQRDSQQFFNFLTAYASDSYVVEKNSAIEFGQKIEMFEGGHIQIAKPENNNDRIYLWVKGQIIYRNAWALIKKTKREVETAANRRVRNIIEYSKQKDPQLLDNLISLSLSNKKASNFELQIKSLVNRSMISTGFEENPFTATYELMFHLSPNYQNSRTPSDDTQINPK